MKARILALAAAALLGMIGCGEDGAASDSASNGVDFVDVQHPDGTEYRCLWSWRQDGYAGGLGMWCERLEGHG